MPKFTIQYFNIAYKGAKIYEIVLQELGLGLSLATEQQPLKNHEISLTHLKIVSIHPWTPLKTSLEASEIPLKLA